jgi:hypothetical protein
MIIWVVMFLVEQNAGSGNAGTVARGKADASQHPDA